MNLSKKIKNLEKRGIISKRPSPMIPFALAFISLALGILTRNFPVKVFSVAFFFLAGFSFLFAVLHLIVVRILEN